LAGFITAHIQRKRFSRTCQSISCRFALSACGRRWHGFFTTLAQGSDVGRSLAKLMKSSLGNNAYWGSVL
jgi:hypothetical protein